MHHKDASILRHRSKGVGKYYRVSLTTYRDGTALITLKEIQPDPFLSRQMGYIVKYEFPNQKMAKVYYASLTSLTNVVVFIKRSEKFRIE